MKIGIYGHPGKQRVIECSSHLIEILSGKRVECYVENKLGKKLDRNDFLYLVPEKELPDNVDLFIAFGGDGTILRLIGIIAGNNIPILAVNAGKLGFLTDLSPDELPGNIDKILRRDFQIEERFMLEGNYNGNKFIALNDIVVSRGAYPRIIKIRIDIGEHHVNTYHCDGIIVATPTGSTAYALSAGGPIVHPSLEGIIISPISTHSLSARHVVSPSNEVIKVKVLTSNENIQLHADGKNILSLGAYGELCVKKSQLKVMLIKIASKNFFDVLRDKLNWGKEKR